MKANGKSRPAKIGPVPSTKRVTGGSSSGGRDSRMPTANATIVPILMKALR